MREESPYIAIVDAYSSGNLLAPEFRNRGLKCVHIQSSAKVPPALEPSFHAEDFTANIVHVSKVEETLAHCSQYPLRCLITGTETGVELADVLSERLGLISNGTSVSVSRRDKFEMVTRVKKSGLRTIPSFKTSVYEEALNWIKENSGWPIVLKPLRSAGTDSVVSCSSEDKFHKVFNSTLGKHDQLGSVIDEVLIQKKITGPEYIVDTVSCNGTHHVTNVWSIVKGSHNGGDFVCDYNQLLHYEEADKNNLLDYTFGVINALGIKQGPAHTELLLTPEGPVLIEIAARMHGAGFPIYSQQCVGYSQVDLTVDAYVDEPAFKAKTQAPYKLQKSLVIVELISGVEGELKDVPFLHQIKELPSYYSMKLGVAPGNVIMKTIDVFTSPGYVVLLHPDPATIWRDYCRIRDLEKRGLYEV